MGVVSPIGNSCSKFLQSLKSGKNGISYISSFNTDKFSVKIAGEVDIDLNNLIDKKEQNRIDRFTALTIFASHEAINNSNILNSTINKNRIGVIIGSGIGGISTFEAQHKLLLKNPKLYSLKVTEFTAEIAKIKKIRQLLRRFQTKFARKRLAILEGRDMGILFPNADVKIFFKCSLKVAARRRLKEYKKLNRRITLKKVERAIRIRNHVDSTRKFSPLRIPQGAVIVDTSKINKKQMFGKIFKIVESKLLLKYGRNYKAR